MVKRRAATLEQSFAAAVIGWQQTYGRHDLPWQRDHDAYGVWISEIMLQQTQVTTVIPYFHRFIARFPDVESLAAAPEDEVFAHWAGLGYYQRARNLHRTAQEIVSAYGGQFPQTPEALSQLPGIGRSTAAAIAAFSFGARAAILDGNVKRVLARYAGIEGWPGEPLVERKLWQLAESLLPDRDVDAYTQGLMDLGSMICTRRKPRCNECPLRHRCVALQRGAQERIPGARPTKTLPLREIVMPIIQRAGEIMLEKRPPTGIWGGLWCLPEFEKFADARAIVEKRYGVRVLSSRALEPIAHGFTHFKLNIFPVLIDVEPVISVARSPGQLWVTPDDALNAAVPAPVRRILRELARQSIAA